MEIHNKYKTQLYKDNDKCVICGEDNYYDGVYFIQLYGSRLHACPKHASHKFYSVKRVADGGCLSVKKINNVSYELVRIKNKR